MRIAICDDENAQCLLLEERIRAWGTARGESVQVRFFPNAEAFWFAYEQDKAFDVLLLDIQMPGTSGMELAKELRKKRDSLAIVLVTALSEYVFEGYQVEALDYLLKPVEDARLFAILDRVAGMRPRPVLLVDHDGVTERLLLSDIVYLESRGHNTRVVCRNGEYESPHLLSRYEERLRDFDTKDPKQSGFCRIHRCYLVNLAHIRAIHKKEVAMDGGESLPVARGRFEALSLAYLAYYRPER